MNSIQGLCRICGSYQENQFLELINDEIKGLMENFCKIELSSNDKFPKHICCDCNRKIIDFSEFCERAKEIQLKFLIEYEVQNVKVEIEELPILYYNDKHQSSFYTPDEFNLTIAKEIDNHIKDSKSEDEENGYQTKIQRESKKRYKQRTKKLEDKKSWLLQSPKTTKDCNRTVKIDAQEEHDGKIWCNIKLKCIKCDFESKGPYDLYSHYLQSHKLHLTYACNSCSQSLSSFHQFINHLINHQKFLKFSCVMCSELFCRTQNLNQHYTIHHHDIIGNVFRHCKQCGYFFRKEVDLLNHELRFHRKNNSTTKTYRDRDIKDTKATFYTVQHLFEDVLANENFNKFYTQINIPSNDKNHDGSLSESYKNRYINTLWSNIALECVDCKKIKTPYLLYLHYNSKHPNEKKYFTCKLCSEHKKFLNFEAFINHTFTIHHEHLRYFCFICNEGIWDYKVLYKHYRNVHENYNIFICLYCGKFHKIGYELKYHLKIHNRTKHNVEGEQKMESELGFESNECNKTLSKKKLVAQNKKVENKIWICDQCGKKFNAKSTLINHSLVHTSERPFLCNVCGEGFKNKYKLNYHKGIHTGEKNFECPTCKKNFRAKGTLKNHMLIHSGEKPWSMLIINHCNTNI